MITKVVNCNTDDFDEYIGRPSIWGNPFRIGIDGTREECINKYREWVITQDHLMENIHTLERKRLGCWCKPKACHGDILVELIENQEYFQF